jgi:ribonuclease G
MSRRILLSNTLKLCYRVDKSGNRSNKATEEQDTPEVNWLIAAAEIARQLRSYGRNHRTTTNPENRKVLFDFLKEEMSDDKENTDLTPSKFD